MGLVKNRRQTRVVKVGNVSIGGEFPIVVQSMTNTKTQDSQTTISQIKRMHSVGCEVVRVAVPDFEAATAIPSIIKGISIPLIADIHFDYQLALAAMKAGAHAIRINPGNISVNKIKEIIACAKDLGVSIRIGVNSGSIDKELLKKFGSPTAEAMAESALQYINLFRTIGFENIKVSLKASDIERTLKAHQLLATICDIPFHIGITEAGPLVPGLVKSSIGIALLLMDGIGDTIRVSLTKDPVEEVRAAYEILRVLGIRQRGPEIISCPTCGRCDIDLFEIVSQLEPVLSQMTSTLKIAIMGCVVNGPGEAKEADIGIAGGKDLGILFKKGKVVKKIPQKQLVKTLLEELNKFK